MEILVDRLPQPMDVEVPGPDELGRGEAAVFVVVIAAVLATAVWLALLFVPPFGIVIAGGAVFIAAATVVSHLQRDYWRDELEADWPLELRADFEGSA